MPKNNLPDATKDPVDVLESNFRLYLHSRGSVRPILEAAAEIDPDEATAWARSHIGRIRRATQTNLKGGRVWGHHNETARVCRCAACVLRRARKGGETPESVAAAKKWIEDQKSLTPG